MKKQILFAVVISVVLSFTACNIYKPYSRPKIETDGLYRGQTDDDTLSLAQLGWRELFVDTVLQRLIDEGLAHNFDLQSAILSIRQSQYQLTQSKAAFAPSISFGASGGYTAGDGRSSLTHSELLSASWEVDLFGKLLNSKRSAQAALLKNEAYRRAVQTQLIANIALNYYTLQMLDRQLSISEETVVRWRKNVELMTLLKQVGQTTQAAVSQSQANLYSVLSLIPDLKRQIRETENLLSLLLARSPDRIERSALPLVVNHQYIRSGVPAQLLANRPDVQQAEAQMMQAYALVNVNRASMYPSLVISAGAGFNNSILGAVLNPAQLIGSVLGGLTLPLFNRLALQTQLKVSKAEQEKSLLNFKKTLLNAGSEVSNALFLYESQQEKLVARRSQIESLEQSVQSIESLMKAGEASYLEILTAQQSLLSAQLTETNDQFAKIKSIVNLYSALGGGK